MTVVVEFGDTVRDVDAGWHGNGAGGALPVLPTAAV